MLRKLRVAAASVAGLLLGMGGIVAANAAEIGDPSGPLTQIVISPDLNCDVRYLGDSEPEFYGDTACATFVAVGGTLYGPASIPAGSSAEPRTSWTPSSQTSGGSGTSTSPYWIKTVVTGGLATVEQLDTYVVGQNSYRTTIQLSVTGDSRDAIIYHGADCYLQDSDDGFGSHNNSTGAITCHAPGDDGEFSSTSRIEEFVPLTAGSRFFYGNYDDMWGAIGTQQPLPNEVRDGSTLIDNAIALSWSVAVPSAGSSSVGMLTNFSSVGLSALSTSVTPSPATITVGDQSEVTIGIANPNLADQAMNSITVTIPVGTAYVAGSSSVGEPTIAGAVLTFTSPGTVSGEGNLSFTFKLDGESEGAGTVAVEGSAASGAPTLGSSASLTVTPADGPQPQEALPLNPTIVQAQCEEGELTLPEVTKPADGAGVSYVLTGDAVSGGTMVLTATADDSYRFPATVPGWTVSANRMIATLTIVLDAVECEPEVPLTPVAPVAPTVTEATCAAGASVVLPTTAGIVYRVSPTNPMPGADVTVTATPVSGFVLTEASGWTLNEETGVAVWSHTLAKAPTNCATDGGSDDLPTTGVDDGTVGLLVAAAALMAGGAFLLYRRASVGH